VNGLAVAEAAGRAGAGLAAAASCAANVRAATARMLEGADGQVADLKDEAAASAFLTAPRPLDHARRLFELRY
jgi:hypothetical protein